MKTQTTPLLRDLARSLRAREVSARDLLDEALRRHRARTPQLHAYKLLDPDGAMASAARADQVLTGGDTGRTPGPMCGIPVSVKDLYGMDGLPTFAGTARQLDARWSRDAWLVERLRAQGAVFVGKTHTVEMAYAGVGINPNWDTPRNPFDDSVHRIPGGSSSGAGVSLHEGSALVALGTDTGGSIRIPASMTGTVGHKTTKSRWPTDGVVPLSHTLDTVGALTRSVEDSVYVFGAVDPAWGDPEVFLHHLEGHAEAGAATGGGRSEDSSHGAAARTPRIGIPRSRIWDDCQSDIARVLHAALDTVAAAGDPGARGAAGGSRTTPIDVYGSLLDQAADLYLTGAIAGPECKAFLASELPGWRDVLHPIVADRLAAGPEMDSEAYRAAQRARQDMAGRAAGLFADSDVLALPGHLITPPPVAELDDPARYREVNIATLRPTCPVSLLGLCALTLPVGLDDAGMPVGLQLVAPAGSDELLLGVALAVERALGRA